MAFQRVQSLGRSGGSKRRDYGMRVSYRNGWSNPKTGKTNSDQVVLTIDGDHLEQLGFDEYAVIMIDVENNELALCSVEDPDRSNGDLVCKFRDERMQKKLTGFKQMFVSTQSCPAEVLQALKSLVDKTFDHNELFEITEDVGSPAFSFLFDGVTVTEETPDGGAVDQDEYADVE